MGIIDETGNEHTYTIDALERAAQEMRGYALIALYCAKSGHSGSCLSCMDILATLYCRVMRHMPSRPSWDERDRLFFSAGHKAPAWYTGLGYTGYFDIKELATLRKFGSPFQGHPDRKKLVGIELSCGSLGQGLSVAVGSALAAKLDKKSYRVFCLMGDGEQQEGQIWEAVMEAAHYHLDNLVGIVDKNELQIDGFVKDVMNIDPLDEKYRAFGWHVISCNGHDMSDLLHAFKEAEITKGKPTVIITKTIKGKGVSFMENQVGWHGKAPNKEELEQALQELGLAYLPKQEMIHHAETFQNLVEEEIKKQMPQFSRDYWWNTQDRMKVEMKPTRLGFGEALKDTDDTRLVTLGADISGSININMFQKEHPERKDRSLSMGIAEQSGTCVAAGLAKEGKTPLFGTYGVFAAGRALDQLRTTVCYGDFNVKIAGAHGGISVGPDGATHQALEEIFQITGLPNMRMLIPCDAIEAKKATQTMIECINGPCYLRYAREATPLVTKETTPYQHGRATIIRYTGREEAQFREAFTHTFADEAAHYENHITIVSCGPEVAEAMRAAWILAAEFGITAQVLNLSTVKPLDTEAIIKVATESGAIVSVEEHQKGGLGNLVAAVIAMHDFPEKVLFRMIGINDTFGESGNPWELIKAFGLSAEHIAVAAKELIMKKPLTKNVVHKCT